MKENDWIVANINNPEFNESDFKNILGLSLDNTLLLPMEEYLKSNFILENDKFKDSLGNFNKDLFKDFYNKNATKFGDFQKNSAMDNYEYGFWDIYQKPDSRIQNPMFKLDTVANPEHISTGVIGPGLLDERTKSDFELAEKQKIYDWDKKEFRNDTPEDSSLFSNPIKFIKNLFLDDPLVLALYEQDEIDPITGELHYKGQNKLNENGEYYFETLGNRSLVGKKVLSFGDIITKEDSLINKYDFFDSDDLEKSVGGVIAKNLAAVAPMAILGPVGTAWYGGFYVARELAKSLPMLYNIATMFGEDEEDPKLLTSIAGIGHKLTGGISEKAKNSTFSFENFGNLISDVALQWGQLKLIANSIAKIRKNTNTIIEAAETKAALEYEKRALEIWNRANNGEMIAAFLYTKASGFDDIKNAVASGAWKTSSVGAAAMLKFVPEALKAFSKLALLGLDLSLIYMSIISNYDVFNDALEHGTTRAEAAGIALGSTLGMFGVDKYAHLGEIFFDETPEKMALRNLRQGLREEAAELSKKIGSKETKETSKKGLMNLIRSSADKASNFIKNYLSGLKNHTLGFFGKSFGEGLEELSEEAVSDSVKALYELGGLFGMFSLQDIGAWSNARERYLMSFFGGAIGGGLFYGVDAIKNPKNTVDLNIQKELLYLVSLGKTGEILDNLEEMKNKGKLASTNLSIDSVTDESGNKVFLTADSEHKSQNDYVYDIMKNSILLMESILNEHSLNLTEDLLFEKMVLSNLRYMVLKDKLFDKSYITLYYDDYQQIVSDIFNIEKLIKDLKDSTSDEEKRKEESDYNLKLAKLEKEREELIKNKDSFLKGEYNLDYVDKMLFYIHPEVNDAFYSSLFEQWVENKYHKDVKDLSEGELKKYSEEWVKLKKTKGKQFLNEAFNVYKEFRTKVEDSLGIVAEDDVMKWGELLKQLKDTSPDKLGLQWDLKIPSKNIDIDNFLITLGINKTAEYDKPWKNDPTKINKAFQLQLAEDSSAGFEIVKDLEDGYWSIHFKTPRTLTIELKLRLFRAAAAVIPEGDKLSTWGELTPGGISGINRFGQLDFLGGIEFEQVGERDVKTKSGGKIDRKKYTPAKASVAGEEEKEYILTNKKGVEIPLYGNTSQLKVTLKDGSAAFMNTGATDPESLISSNEILVNDNAGGTFRINADDVVKVEDGNLLVSEFKDELDIKIPIWKKTITGESEEDFRDRDTQRDGESKEDFKARKLARENKRRLYNLDHFIESVRKFLNVNDVIDRGTYRELVARIGSRRLDVLKFLIKNSNVLTTSGIVTADNIRKFTDILQESLNKLHPDFSNEEEIIQDILKKSKKLRRIEYNKRNSFRKVYVEETLIPVEKYGSVASEKITLDDIIDAIDSVTDSKVSLSDELTEEQESSGGYITREDLKGILYYGQNGEETDLFREALDTAIKVHNLKLEGFADDSPEVKALKNPLKSKTYKQITSEGTEEDTNFLFIEEGAYEIDRDDEILPIFEALLEQELNDLMEKLKSNSDLKTLNDLHKKATLDLNPVVKIFKAIIPKLGEDFNDIEETLEAIYNQFESLEIPTAFTLSPKQLEALNKFYKYFGYVRAVIRSAKTKSSYFDYLPYNNSLNTFMEDNKDIIKDVKKLLEINEDLANVIEESFAHFDNEIQRWIKRGELGTINKREMFSKFDLKFNKARLDFFNQIKDLCKVGEKDLFKGFEHIDVDKPDAIVEIEKLVYNNFKELGWDISELILIISKQVKANLVIKQDSGFNKSLDSDFVFTDYDKFIFLTSLVANDPIDFYEFYKDYVSNSKGKDGQKLAPLTFLEYNIKLGFIHKNSMDFINKVLEEFASLNKIDVPIIKNAVFISGIAGVGKTDVVVRALLDDKSVWVSGPSSTLIDSLKQIIPHAKTLGHKELFNTILGETLYNEILSESKKATSVKLNKPTDAYSGKYLKVGKNDIFATLNFDKITFNIKDVPKQLVIDEITLFSNTELLLLSKWANKAGVQLIFAGDSHLNGNIDIGFNVTPDSSFAFRTPEMKISLRDANIWKYKNQLYIVELLDDLDKYGDAERITKYLSNFNFHYFLNDDKFTGELVTDKLEDLVISKLDGTIAFIGKTTSENYQKIKGLGKNIEIFNSVDDILGKEFDYVISDIDLSYNPIEGYSKRYNLTTYLKTLYTIITRSKKGTVLIDNKLTSMIKGSVSENYSNENVGITPEVTKLYVEEKIKFLNSLKLERKIPLEPKEEPLKEGETIGGVEFEEPKEEPDPENEEPEIDPEEEGAVLDEEAKQGTIIPVYGNINMSGLIMDRTTGKLHKAGNRDLGIFLSDGEEIELKDRPKLDLFQLKSLIHFDRLNSFWYNKLKTKFFTLEELQNIKYYVCAEDYDPNIHRLLTKENGYKEGELAFSVGGIKKVFTLIGVIEKDGKQYEVTLGGLSNPETLRKNAKDIRDPKTSKIVRKGTITRLRERAALTTDPELLQKLKDYADNYDSRVDNYEKLLINLATKGRWLIRKPNFDRCTRISKTVDSEGHRVYHPLNEYFDLNTELYVVSPVYVQVNKDGEDENFEGIDSKHKGKPVIFVSAFTLNSPTELVDIYTQLKADPNGVPEVRKIILEHSGVWFSDLVNGKVEGLGDSDELRFPFSNTATAFRMYMSLWNFRARITRFNDAVDEYIKKNGLSIDELNRLALEESEDPGSTDEKFKPLRDLNAYLDELGIEQFRLGYSKANGFYSRKINATTNGTYINYQMALDYLKVVELLFKNVLDVLITPPSATSIKSIMGKTSDFDKHVAMETWVKKLSSLRSIQLSLKSEDTNETVNFAVKDADLIRTLPLNLVSICRNINLALKFSGGISEFRRLISEDTTLYSKWYIKYKNKPTDTEWEYIDYMSIVDGISGGLKDTDENVTIQGPGIRTLKGDKGTYDRRILNFFDLAFHGMVHENSSDEEAAKSFPADGVLLKYGIFRDTFLAGNSKNPKKAFRLSSNNRKLYRTNALPSSPVLKIDITEWDGKTPEEKSGGGGTVETELDRVNRILGLRLTNLDLISTIILNNLQGIFNTAVDQEDLLNTIIEYKETDGIYSFRTLGEILSQDYGINPRPGEITNSSEDSEVHYKYKLDDETEYILRLNGTNLEVVSNRKIRKENTLNDELEKIRLSLDIESILEYDFEEDVSSYVDMKKYLLNDSLSVDDRKSTLDRMIAYLDTIYVGNPTADNSDKIFSLEKSLTKIQNGIKAGEIICN